MSNFQAILHPDLRVIELDQGTKTIPLSSHVHIYLFGAANYGEVNSPTLLNGIEDYDNLFSTLYPYSPNGQQTDTWNYTLFLSPDTYDELVNSGVNFNSLNSNAYSIISDYFFEELTDVANQFFSTLGAYNIANIIVNRDSQQFPTSIRVTLTPSYGGGYGNAGYNLYDQIQTTRLALELIYKNNSLAQVFFIRAGDHFQPKSSDYTDAIDTIEKDDNYPGGFLIAPSAFAHLTSRTKRIQVGNTLISKAEELDMMALLDNSASVNKQNFNPYDVINDADGYQTPARGHSAYYFPYLEADSGICPSSPVAAAIATKRFAEEGIKPNAGLKYPIKGILQPSVKVTSNQQGILDPRHVNCIRSVYNQGSLIWGMRTRQESLVYRYFHTRVIANIVNRSFRDSIDLKRQLFDLQDGQGRLYLYLESLGNSIGRQLYKQGLLYGKNELEAFRCKCDFDNNSSDDIAQGFVKIEFFYAISPAIEKMIVNPILVPINSLVVENTLV